MNVEDLLRKHPSKQRPMLYLTVLAVQTLLLAVIRLFDKITKRWGQ